MFNCPTYVLFRAFQRPNSNSFFSFSVQTFTPGFSLIYNNTTTLHPYSTCVLCTTILSFPQCLLAAQGIPVPEDPEGGAGGGGAGGGGAGAHGRCPRGLV